MRRFLKFNAASALGIGVQLGVLWLLTHRLAMDAVAATPPAVLAAIAHNFMWHWRWTWADRAIPRADAPAAFARFAAANGAVSLAGNLAVMAVLVRGAGLPPLVANVAAIAACGLINYGLGDAIVFRRPPALPRAKAVSTPPLAYSALKAASGSTRDARQAGIAPAIRPTTRRPAVALTSVAGSRGERP